MIDYAPFSDWENRKRGIKDVRRMTLEDRCAIRAVVCRGVEISGVFRACPAEGWLDRFVTDPDARIIVIDGVPSKERLYGPVEVITDKAVTP